MTAEHRAQLAAFVAVLLAAVGTLAVTDHHTDTDRPSITHQED